MYLFCFSHKCRPMVGDYVNITHPSDPHLGVDNCFQGLLQVYSPSDTVYVYMDILYDQLYTYDRVLHYKHAGWCLIS